MQIDMQGIPEDIVRPKVVENRQDFIDKKHIWFGIKMIGFRLTK